MVVGRPTGDFPDTMLAVTTREQALGILQGEHTALRDLADGLDREAFVRPATIGGGDWSAKDLLAHVTTWEEIALRTIEEWRSGEKPWIEATPKNADDINAETVVQKAKMSADDVRAEFERVHAELVGKIRDFTDDEWATESFWEAERATTFGAVLGAVLAAPRRPFAHVSAHLADLEAYVASASRD